MIEGNQENEETRATTKNNSGPKHKVVHLKDKAVSRLRKLLSTKKGRVVAIIAGVIVLLVVLFAVPFTRYLALGPIIKKDVSITVIDSETKQPVSNALVKIGSSEAQSDSDGVAKLKAVSVGQPGLKVTKQYYEDYNKDYAVPVISSPEQLTVEFVAKGRQISVTVVNKISGDPVADVVVSSEGTKATSNSEGIALLVLPPLKNEWQATLSKDGYNSHDVKLFNTPETIISSIVPAGSIYYLSKATGKINVMKSDIDGSNAKVVIKGTGQESNYQTTLLSSRDWKYSALLATRTDNKDRVYLIDNEKGDFTVIDEGDASFDFVGWSDHRFIYTVTRNTDKYYDNKRQALKSFNAESRSLAVLDETIGLGISSYNNQYEYFNRIYIMSNEIVYLKSWAVSVFNENSGKKMSFVSINPSSGVKKVVQTFTRDSTSAVLYEPQALYLRVKNDDDPATFYVYEDKVIKSLTNINDNKYYEQYPTFIVSPSGEKTLWYEQRDGKNVLFIGNKEGGNVKTITNLSEYTPYGWFGDNDEYILLSKGGSELYIGSAVRAMSDSSYAIKVTDYHKTQTYSGYGYGYGGQ